MDSAFVSYSRQDIAFVRRLHAALEARGRKAWVDWEGIPPTDKWLARIRAAIDEADAFVFVISPDSVASDVCQRELEHAVRQHKRLIPVVHREVEADRVRPELAELNYIFARDSDSLDDACERLVTALDTDLAWVRAHTRLLVRAAEWDREGRDASYTLRGRDLNDFEEWFAQSPDKEPRPTALQAEYLLVSRRTVTRRRRLLGGAVAVGLSIAVGLGTLAYVQHLERERQATIAEARQLINRAEALRDGPVDEVGARGRLAESLRAATRALATLHGLGVVSLDADRAVRRSYAALPKWRDHTLEHRAIDASAFDAAGAYLALFLGRDRLMVWDTARRREVAACPQPLAAMESALAVAVADGGTLAATAVYNSSRAADETTLTVWSLADCRPRLRVAVSGRRERLALGGDGGYLVTEGEGWGVRFWEVASGTERRGDFADLVFAFALGPDGDWLATLERRRGERRYWLRIHDLADGRLVREWLHPARGLWLQWRASVLTVGGQEEASLYDPATGGLLARQAIEAGRLAVSANGQRVAVPVDDYGIEVRDALSGRALTRTSHDTEVAALAFGTDGRSLITVDAVGRRLREWRFADDPAFAALRDEAPITALRFADGGALLYTATDEGGDAWRLPAPGELVAPRREAAFPEAIDVSAAPRSVGPVAAGCGEAATRLEVSAPGGARSLILDAPALATTLGRDGARLAVLLGIQSTRGGCRRRLEVWDLETGERIAMQAFEPLLDGDRAAHLHFAGDDHYLVIGVRGGFEVVDAERLTPVATLYHPDARRVVVQGGGQLAATLGRRQGVRIWSMDDGNEIARVAVPSGVMDLALSDDGRWLATLDDSGMARLWPLAPGDLVQQACRWLAEPCP